MWGKGNRAKFRADLDEGQDGGEIVHPLMHEFVWEELLLKDRPRDPHASCREAACSRHVTCSCRVV